MSTCFLVLGTPRSGTSCVTGILSILGVPVGKQLLPPSEMNEKGFYQDIEFEQLFDHCPEWMPKYPGKNVCHIEELHALIQKRCEEHKVWGLKIRLGAFIVQELEKFCSVKLIVLKRDRQRSIESLTKWSEACDQNPEQVIDRSLDAIEQVTRDREVTLIDYNALLLDKASYIDKLVKVTGTVFNRETLTFVDTELRHY